MAIFYVIELKVSSGSHKFCEKRKK